MNQAYFNEYRKEKYRTFIVRFHKEKDAHIIARIDRQSSKIDYVRKLVKENINDLLEEKNKTK